MRRWLGKGLCEWLEEDDEKEAARRGTRCRLCFPFTSREGGTQTIQPAFPHLCMQTSLLHSLFCSVSHSPCSLTLTIFLSHTLFLPPPVFPLPLFTSWVPTPLPSFLSPSTSSPCPMPLVLCLRPLIRFGPPHYLILLRLRRCAAEHPGKGSSSESLQRNHVSRA